MAPEERYAHLVGGIFLGEKEVPTWLRKLAALLYNYAHGERHWVEPELLAFLEELRERAPLEEYLLADALLTGLRVARGPCGPTE